MYIRKYLFLALVIHVACHIPVKASEPVSTGSECQFITASFHHTGDTSFILDDGTSEDGWAINPGYLGWFGNFFPVSAGTTGILKSFQLYFLNNPNGRDQQLSISVFNESFHLVGSSAGFLATQGSWITVNVGNIPFSGPFYAMVKWNNIVEASHWLGLDNNGPYSPQNLARYYDGNTFHFLSDVVGCDPGSFLIRANASTNPAGIGDLVHADGVSVFPNPATDYIEISSVEKLKSVEIIDLQGKILIECNGVNDKKLKLDLQGLSPGAYIVRITARGGIYSKMISVIH